MQPSETTTRFERLRTLGEGGMGVVYEARDRRSGRVVAVKTLRAPDGTLLLRLKREFRTLQGLSHRNLVRLEELVEGQGEWLLVMERIEGTDFLSSLRGAPPPIDPLSETVLSRPDGTDAGLTQPAPPDGRRAPPCEPAVLRERFAQLAQGLLALHAHGLVHCDLKPSNVLVEHTGRVVLLDFGLVKETAPLRSASGSFAGTPLYMAPEQIEGAALGPATDWYAVGAMLYEALTGQPPHLGSATQILTARLLGTPLAAPSTLAKGVPEDLEALCLALLSRRPEERPDGARVVEVLGLPAVPALVTALPELPFVGREAELAALAAAYERAGQGRCECVHVVGPSGFGKSALLERFTAGLDALVLRGRCFERESVPFKALDDLIDDLASALRALPPLECAALLPRDVGLLTQLFPVLERVPAIAHAPQRKVERGDAEELRRRASKALEELLVRLSDHRRLVVWIDDLQWGDGDSARVLLELLRSQEPPAMLLLLSYRAEDEARSPVVRSLRGLDSRLEPPRFERVAVGPLSATSSADLASALLGAGGTEKQRRRVAEEAGGSPLFVAELARALERGESAEASLAELLRARVARLPESARALVELLAVARGPLPQGLALEILGVDAEAPAALALLRSERLLRTSGAGAEDLVETAHDRVRESVLEGLSGARALALHAAIAKALQGAPEADPELLAVHLRATGDRAGAGRALLRAAQRAEGALAFQHAAELYRAALEEKGLEGAEAQRARVAMAEALAAAGDSPASADAFLEAAKGARPEDAAKLRALATGQLLRAGHIDEGLRLLRAEFARLGMPLAESEALETATIVLNVGRLALGSLRPRRASRGAIDALDLQRMELCYQAVFCAFSNPLLCLDASLRLARLGLGVGHEEYAALGLSAVRASMVMFRSGQAVSKPLERLAAPLQVHSQKLHFAWLELSRAGYFASFDSEDWDDATSEYLRCIALVEREPGHHYVTNISRFLLAWALFYAGRLAEMSSLALGIYRDALMQRDTYTASNFSHFVSLWALAAGDLDEAARSLNINDAWQQRGFQVQHYHHTVSLARVGRASSELGGILQIERCWYELHRSSTAKIPGMSTIAHHERALCALAAAHLGHERRAMLSIVEQSIPRVDADDRPSGRAWAALLRAGLACARSGPRASLTALLEAERLCELAKLRALAPVARRCRGIALGGAEGAALLASGDATLAALGVRSPETWTRVHLPGFEASAKR